MSSLADLLGGPIGAQGAANPQAAFGGLGLPTFFGQPQLGFQPSGLVGYMDWRDELQIKVNQYLKDWDQ